MVFRQSPDFIDCYHFSKGEGFLSFFTCFDKSVAFFKKTLDFRKGNVGEKILGRVVAECPLVEILVLRTLRSVE